MVFGDGPGAGAPLVQHPLVPLVSFTGGTATGERIYSMCAPMYKKMSLELGGKNASIVFEDADLQDAIDTTVRSCFTNSGMSFPILCIKITCPHTRKFRSNMLVHVEVIRPLIPL